MFNNLRNTLIFRVFASEGESARKYSLIFLGRTENSDKKSWHGTSLDSSPVSSLATTLIRNKMICRCAHLSLSLDKTGGGPAIPNLEKTMFFSLLLRSPFTIFI